MTAIPLQHKSIVRIALVTALLLLVPLVAMQFSRDVTWSLFDFLVAGALLSGAGLTYELLAKKAGSIVHRAALGVAVGTALFLVWANLAVGLVGSEDNPANVMYVGVLAVALVGSILARFQPRGMARAMFATVIAQALLALIALTVWRPPASSGAEPVEGVKVLGVTTFFVMLWATSASLFRRAHARSSAIGTDADTSD